MTGFRNNHLALLSFSEVDTRLFWDWCLDDDGETTVSAMILKAGSIEAVPFQQPWSKHVHIDPPEHHYLDAGRHACEWKAVADL
jgi:hypothetical protein